MRRRSIYNDARIELALINLNFHKPRPVCPSGVQPVQSTTRVQLADGTWTTLATGAFRCGNQQTFGGAGPR